MSTENNMESLYENSIKILSDLIAFKTISGEDNSSLIDYCDKILKDLGFEVVPKGIVTRHERFKR